MTVSTDQIARMLRLVPESHENDPPYGFTLALIGGIAFDAWGWAVCRLVRWWVQ